MFGPKTPKLLGEAIAGSRCPDCGYMVKPVWVLLKCRGCNVKRLPKPVSTPSLDESLPQSLPLEHQLEPLDRCCRQCGSSAIRVQKRDSIEAYDLPYAVLMKEIDYREEVQLPSVQATVNTPQANPYGSPAGWVAPKLPGYAPISINPNLTGNLLNILEGPQARQTPSYPDVFEDEVVQQRYVSQRSKQAWKSDPFSWQARIEDQVSSS